MQYGSCVHITNVTNYHLYQRNVFVIIPQKFFYYIYTFSVTGTLYLILYLQKYDPFLIKYKFCIKENDLKTL